MAACKILLAGRRIFIRPPDIEATESEYFVAVDYLLIWRGTRVHPVTIKSSTESRADEAALGAVPSLKD